MLSLKPGEPWGNQGDRIASVDIEYHQIVTTSGGTCSFAKVKQVDGQYWICSNT